MDQAVSTLLGAFIGAFAGISGGVGLEAYRRRRDRQGVAMALAGAVETELWAIKRRGHIALFEGFLLRIEKGETITFYGFADKQDAQNPIFNAYLEKLGSLGGELPAHTIQFFQTMWGIRMDISRLVAGEFGTDNVTIARLIRADLALAQDTIRDGADLARRLRRSAGQ